MQKIVPILDVESRIRLAIEIMDAAVAQFNDEMLASQLRASAQLERAKRILEPNRED